MGKHVVYIRAREEAELKAAGLDVGEWVRERIREALDQRRKKPLDGGDDRRSRRCEKM